jgi:hypothetical protein
LCTRGALPIEHRPNSLTVFLVRSRKRVRTIRQARRHKKKFSGLEWIRHGAQRFVAG